MVKLMTEFNAGKNEENLWIKAQDNFSVVNCKGVERCSMCISNCVAYVIHYKNTSNSCYSTAYVGILQIKQNSLAYNTSRKLVYQCQLIDFLEQPDGDWVVAFRDEKVMVSNYLWMSKIEFEKMFQNTSLYLSSI